VVDETVHPNHGDLWRIKLTREVWLAPSRWLRPTCYFDGYPGLLWGDHKGVWGPRATSVFCHQAQDVRESFTLLRVGMGDWPNLQRQRGSHPSSVHSGHIVDKLLVAGEVKGSFCPMSCQVVLKQAPGGVHCCLAHLGVGWGGLRAAIKSWAFHWSQASSQLLNILNAIFTRSPWGGLMAVLCLFKFSLNIREGLGNKMRVKNNYSILGRWVSCQVISYAWVRYLNSFF
jgi:hypothetical protein